MPCCLLVILMIAFPRAILICMALFTTYLQHAYHNWLIPILGFVFLPVTTIVYAWLVNNGMVIGGINLVLLLIAVIIDMGSFGGGEYHRRRRW